MLNTNVIIYIVIIILISIFIYYILRIRKNKPIIKNFKASNIWKAFLLNSIAASLVIFIALTTKRNFDTFRTTAKNNSHSDDDVKEQQVVQTTNVTSVILTLTSTFVSSMLAYTVMYVTVGFGGGMMTTS